MSVSVWVRMSVCVGVGEVCVCVRVCVGTGTQIPKVRTLYEGKYTSSW